MNTIELKDVRFQWSAQSEFALAVSHFALAKGEKVLLLGESGSGKSTLLSLIAGFIEARAGHISVAGQDMSALSPSKRDNFRAETMGVIFQQFNLLPFASVRDNILLPLRFAKARSRRVQDHVAEAKRICEKLNLPPEVFLKPAGRLSVGQQQRVACARALIGQPPLVIADEPTSALDAKSQSAFLAQLFEQCEAHAASLLMVSHDPRLGSDFDRVIELEDLLIKEAAQ